MTADDRHDADDGRAGRGPAELRRAEQPTLANGLIGILLVALATVALLAAAALVALVVSAFF